MLREGVKVKTTEIHIAITVIFKAHIRLWQPLGLMKEMQT